MRRSPLLLPLCLILTVPACGKSEPARPGAADEQRFRDVETMLDEAAAGDEADETHEKGAAPEDAAPSRETAEAGAD